jgi:hypothetical protein
MMRSFLVPTLVFVLVFARMQNKNKNKITIALMKSVPTQRKKHLHVDGRNHTTITSQTHIRL